MAGPFAGMLLADLGADVIKVEPPAGDAWRRYEPFADGESRYFYSLNRNKRSVVLDLKDEEGRRASRALIRTADVVLHNLPPARARRFGLDRESVREVNPAAVWCCVSALGSDGPEAELTAFDLVAQALSGLLLANAAGVRLGSPARRRDRDGRLHGRAAGGDRGALRGLVGRARDGAPGGSRCPCSAPRSRSRRSGSSRSRSSIGRARASAGRGPPLATPDDLERHARDQRAEDELEPYYRAYARGRRVLRARLPARTPAPWPPPRCWDSRIRGRPTRRRLRPSAAEREQRLALVAEFERRVGGGARRRLGAALSLRGRARGRGPPPRSALRTRPGAGQRPRADASSTSRRAGEAARLAVQDRRRRDPAPARRSRRSASTPRRCWRSAANHRRER